ncbi:MAG: trypsin-like peptidase domain-containing protein [Actinomycetota bacterium]|nr:trypsin-like peptidase domain-containing protein [Actinomycetota bacterium]
MRVRKGAFVAAAAALVSLALAACGDDEGDSSSEAGSTAPGTTEQVIVQASGGDFNPAEIYEKDGPGVVTVISIFGQGEDPLASAGAGQGSGFVVSKEGEIITNTHVVTTGGAGNGGGQPTMAEQVYVEFSDRNRAPAEIVGFDADADLALIKVDPGDIDDLTVLPISERDEYAVGEPVAAIGSPFGERQSVSVGIVSAIDRSIESLTDFSIDNAIQTDASINPGNSGGPLLDGNGEVIGVNQQIQTSSGTNSGVGFAIPATALRFSLEQLREDGDVDYAYLGVSTQGIWPQLADELGLDVETGALIADVVDGGPADDAELVGSDGQKTFQGTTIDTGGDVIVAVDGTRLERESDLAELISRRRPGQTVEVEIIRDGDRRTIEVELEPRPSEVASN